MTKNLGIKQQAKKNHSLKHDETFEIGDGENLRAKNLFLRIAIYKHRFKRAKGLKARNRCLLLILETINKLKLIKGYGSKFFNKRLEKCLAWYMEAEDALKLDRERARLFEEDMSLISAWKKVNRSKATLDRILKSNKRLILANQNTCTKGNCLLCKSCNEKRHAWRYLSTIEQRCDHCGARRPMPKGF